jgi:hypothetical protein
MSGGGEGEDPFSSLVLCLQKCTFPCILKICLTYTTLCFPREFVNWSMVLCWLSNQNLIRRPTLMFWWWVQFFCFEYVTITVTDIVRSIWSFVTVSVTVCPCCRVSADWIGLSSGGNGGTTAAEWPGPGGKCYWAGVWGQWAQHTHTAVPQYDAQEQALLWCYLACKYKVLHHSCLIKFSSWYSHTTANRNYCKMFFRIQLIFIIV